MSGEVDPKSVEASVRFGSASAALVRYRWRTTMDIAITSWGRRRRTPAVWVRRLRLNRVMSDSDWGWLCWRNARICFEVMSGLEIAAKELWRAMVLGDLRLR